jgi:hypothetical protein
MTDGVVRRLPVKGKDGTIDLIEIDGGKEKGHVLNIKC